MLAVQVEPLFSAAIGPDQEQVFAVVQVAEAIAVRIAETSQVCYHTMQEDLTQNRLHPGISMRFETCEVWVRLFKSVSPMINLLQLLQRLRRGLVFRIQLLNFQIILLRFRKILLRYVDVPWQQRACFLSGLISRAFFTT